MADLVPIVPGDFIVIESSMFSDRHAVGEVIDVTPSMVGVRRVREIDLPEGDEDAGHRRKRNAVVMNLGRDRAAAVKAISVIADALAEREEAFSVAKLAYYATLNALHPISTPEKSA